MNSFFTDLEFGQTSEDILRHTLKLHGYDSKAINDHSCDIEYQVKVEVKTDREWRRTGNVAIEYKYKGEPSGISTTQAHIYVYVLDGISSMWYVQTDALRAYLKNITAKRVKGGDDNMSDLILLTLSQFFSIFRRL